jgi:O-antigen/teichoic acid export membrane protein
MSHSGRGSLLRHTLSGMLWMSWSSAANALLKFGVLIMLTRLLSPEDFGVVNAALIVILLAAGLSQLGLGPALVQRPTIEPRHESTAFFASIGLGILIGAVVYVAAPAIAAFYRIPGLETVLRALAWYFPLRGLTTTSEFLLQRDLRFRWLANLEVVTYGLGYGLVGVVMAAYGWGVWSLVGGHLAYAAAKGGAAMVARRPTLSARPNWQSFRDLLNFGSGYTGAYLGVIAANQADNLVVARWLGSVALGFYGRAYQLMAVPAGLLGDVLDNVLFPTLSRVQHDRERLASAYLRGSALIALVTCPASVVLLVLAPELVGVVFGAPWLTVVPLFQVLVLGMMLRTNYRMSDSLARAAGIGFGRVWRQAAYAGFVFIGAWIGQHWGVTGVPLGVAVALLLNFLLMAHLALGVAGVSWRTFFAAHLPGIYNAALFGSVTWAVVVVLRASGVSPLLRLVAGGLVVALTAAAVLWRAPAPLLGTHGQWILHTLRTGLAARFGKLTSSAATERAPEGQA